MKFGLALALCSALTATPAWAQDDGLGDAFPPDREMAPRSPGSPVTGPKKATPPASTATVPVPRTAQPAGLAAPPAKAPFPTPPPAPSGQDTPPAPVSPGVPAPPTTGVGVPPGSDDATSTPAAPPPITQIPLEKATPSNPDQKPSLERFKEALTPHGRWVNTPQYGEVWTPNVSADWRPYTKGRWVYTEHGWTFVSYDPWGWAPFHYGRWVYQPGIGWVWLPGYQWAPAWVTWRYGADYIGWAPLGPVGVAASYYYTPSLWLAVRGPHFYRPLLRSYFVPTRRVRSTVFRTTYYPGVPRARMYWSPPAKYIAHVVRRPIVRLSARRVAPYWVGRGFYRPRRLVRRALRRARVRGRYVARPTSWRGRPWRRRSGVRKTWRGRRVRRNWRPRWRRRRLRRAWQRRRSPRRRWSRGTSNRWRRRHSYRRRLQRRSYRRRFQRRPFRRRFQPGTRRFRTPRRRFRPTRRQVFRVRRRRK